MSEVNITRNTELNPESLFNSAKGKTVAAAEVKTPLQMMMEQKNQGLAIEKDIDDDGSKRGGAMTDERLEGFNETIKNLDELAEKAKKISITEKPKSDTEMAQLIDLIDSTPMEEIDALNADPNINEDNIVKADDIMNVDITAESVIDDGSGIARTNNIGGIIVSRSAGEEAKKAANTESEKSAPEKRVSSKESDESIVIVKDESSIDGTKVIDFTPEERAKLTESEEIRLIKVNKLNINIGKVTPIKSTDIIGDYTAELRKTAINSVPMTFPVSRFRATLKGLTFGEYIDLASTNDISDSDKLIKKSSIIYNAITSCSIGGFTSFEEFLHNFGYRDLAWATYALYIATNTDVLEMPLKCSVETCNAQFSVKFSTRQLIVDRTMSDYLKNLIVEIGEKDGDEAVKFHNESSVIKKTVIELPTSGIAFEVGFRSLYDMIYRVMPYANDLEAYVENNFPNQSPLSRQAIALFIMEFISAAYIKDENGEYTRRVDDLFMLTELIYSLPRTDSSILFSLSDQIDEDYGCTFGIQNVECPACHTKSTVVPINIDDEVFRTAQQQANVQIDRKSLPRL